MADLPVIAVEHLSKRYVIGHAGQQDTLRDTLAHGVKGLWSALLRRNQAHRATKEDFWALRDLSFEVQRGEVVGIIGRNGAGKSTLLKILSRITEPTEGRVSIRGRVASLLEVGTGFHPELSGRENIFLNGAILGMRRAEIRRKFDEIVAFAEVEQFLDTPVKHYSSGMYVRLAFAVAAHLEPEVLVVDEVLAVGDYAFQKKCLGKISAIASEGNRTVLFVSHNLGSVTGLCNKAVWLTQGRLRTTGPAAAVVLEYVRSQTEQTRSDYNFETFGSAERLAGRFLIRSLRINDGLPVTHRQPFRVRLQFRTRAAVEGVGFGLAFCTPDGTRLATYDSDFEGQRRAYPANHEGSIDFLIDDLPLGPGRYSLDCGARSGDVTGLDYLPGCGTIDVNPGPGTSAGAVQIPGGGLRLQAHWHDSPAA